VGAAKEVPARFNAVAYDPATAVRALWRKGMNSAFKRVEVMRGTVENDFHYFVVLVSTNFTSVHNSSLNGVGLAYGFKLHRWLKRTTG
jgi:hypothetical protein